jgi:replication factor A2
MRKVGLTNRQDKYISVLGSLKVFGGKRHISATHVRLITDPNEIAHHALKAQWVSLSLRGASEGGGGAAAVSFHFYLYLTIANRQKPAAAAANDYTANTSSVNESNYAALPKLQREIMELVAKDDTDEGMHVSAVSRGVSGMGQYSGDKVM